MTNVMNTSTNLALTSNVHATSLTQQPDDLLPSLASLSFNVSSSGELSASSNAAHTSQSLLKEGTNECTTTLSTLLNPIVNNNTVDAKDLKKQQVDSVAELQVSTNMLTVLTSQTTGNNSVASVSPSMSSSQPQYDFTTKISEENSSSVAAMWSNIDDGSNPNATLPNGFKNNSNYSNSLVTTLMNNTNMTNIQHQNRRAITASHGGFQPGLPPNNCAPRNMMPQPSIQQHGNHHPHNMHKSNPQDHQSHHMAVQQQQHQQQHQQPQHPHQQNLNFHQTPNAIERDPIHEQHRHPQKPNLYNSNYPVWSNPASSMPWQAQHQQAAINNSIPVCNNSQCFCDAKFYSFGY